MIAIIVDEIVNVGFRYDYVVIVREILKFRKTLYCIQYNIPISENILTFEGRNAILNATEGWP